jgi:predicted ATPase
MENGKKLAAARCNAKIAAKRAARADRKYTDAASALADVLRLCDRMDKYRDDARAELEAANEELAAIMNSLN